MAAGKYGEGAFGQWFDRGFDELGNAILPGSNVGERGSVYGHSRDEKFDESLDQQRIVDRDFDGDSHNESIVDSRLRQAERGRENDEDRDASRDMDLER